MLMMLLNFDDARNGSFSFCPILSSTHAAKETNIIRTKGEEILPLEARVHLIYTWISVHQYSATTTLHPKAISISCYNFSANRFLCLKWTWVPVWHSSEHMPKFLEDINWYLWNSTHETVSNCQLFNVVADSPFLLMFIQIMHTKATVWHISCLHLPTPIDKLSMYPFCLRLGPPIVSATKHASTLPSKSSTDPAPFDCIFIPLFSSPPLLYCFSTCELRHRQVKAAHSLQHSLVASQSARAHSLSVKFKVKSINSTSTNPGCQNWGPCFIGRFLDAFFCFTYMISTSRKSQLAAIMCT